MRMEQLVPYNAFLPMLSRQTRSLLTTYLLAMIVLNVFVLWHSRSGIPIGLPDFTIFYTAGKIVHQGQGAHLYDNELQESVQRSFSSIGIAKRGSILPYNHPPFEALVFTPFARVSYVTAYFCWLVINILLIVSTLLLLRPHFAVLGKEPLFLWLLAGFAFYPNFIALVQGQDSIFVLFCYSMAFAALRGKAEFRAGGWFGLGLCKFHLILPFVLPFLLLKRRRLIAGFLIVAVALVFVGFVAAGWSGWQAYPGYVLGSESNTTYFWNRSPGNMANLRGLIWTLLPGTHAGLRAGMLILFSGLIFAGVVYAWRSAGANAYSQTVFCLSLIATALLSYHIYTHDLSLLFLAILLALESTISIPPKRVWTKKPIYVCLAMLSCNPIYLVLTLRYKQLEIVAGVLLVLLMLLWIAFVDSNIAPKRREDSVYT